MEKRNQYDERQCSKCGLPVAAGQGFVRTVRDPDTLTATHTVTHEECPAEGVELPRWAVPASGRTPGGNQAVGVAFVDSPSRPEGGVPANDAARLLEPPVQPGDPHVAAQWVAYQQLRGLSRTTMPLSIDQLDDVLEGADLEAMDAEVARRTNAILEGAQ